MFLRMFISVERQFSATWHKVWWSSRMSRHSMNFFSFTVVCQTCGNDRIQPFLLPIGCRYTLVGPRELQNVFNLRKLIADHRAGHKVSTTVFTPVAGNGVLALLYAVLGLVEAEYVSLFTVCLRLT